MISHDVTYIGAFIAGLLSFLSPCVFPLIPSYITYITGVSFADLQAEHPSHIIRQKSIFHSLSFIAGFTIVFVLLGASATYIGSVLQENATIIRKTGGVLLVILGVHVTGILPLKFLLGEKRVSIKHKPAGYVGSFLVGIAFAAGWTPCIGPILAAILAVAATQDSVYHGILLLLLYSMGLGVPFFISALAMHRFLIVFNRFKKYIHIFEIFTGLLLIVIGVLIYTNWLSRLSGFATVLFKGFE
ncbi:MAG: cytochrome c biogenesis CcdA family protein [Desulfuromonadaceae bacterium]|nr:cytochrome c biogenesis CcdA family protein [Desulfuromonadaceae bacterium]MDD2846937.1 cytochrome c biogenesis CcdA family protein [Desulfuromonadaceae bacterium]MDD4129085.1 cytochrome c biogenesis CcdA family protein [Desulfuromonadaceae bacterium]